VERPRESKRKTKKTEHERALRCCIKSKRGGSGGGGGDVNRGSGRKEVILGQDFSDAGFWRLGVRRWMLLGTGVAGLLGFGENGEKARP
jgi:hypothetical protein